MSGVEWRYVKAGRVAWWWADLGPLGLRVATDYSWDVSGVDGGASKCRGPCASLEAAQSAAISAAVELLCEALASVPVERRDPFMAIRDVHAASPGLTILRDCRPLQHEFFALDVDDLMSIARVCITAALAARKETP